MYVRCHEQSHTIPFITLSKTTKYNKQNLNLQTTKPYFDMIIKNDITVFNAYTTV